MNRLMGPGLLAVVGLAAAALLGVAGLDLVLFLRAPAPALLVFAGYADSIRPAPQADFPEPWAGSAGTTFVGTGPPYDTGALSIDNPAASPVTIAQVWVQIGAVRYELWGRDLRLGGQRRLLLTQTGFIVAPAPGRLPEPNFDTSEAPAGGCATSGPVPAVNIRIGDSTTRYRDRLRVLTTGGRDRGNCPPTGNESHPWQQLAAP